MTAWRIVCDIGGTHIRTARCEGNAPPASVAVSPTRDCEDLVALLLDYARSFDDIEALDGIAVAAAGPVEVGRVQLTNAPLLIDEAQLRAAFGGGPQVRIVNDLEAVAWSLPYLSEAQATAIRTPQNALPGNLLVVNVGTGFGASMLVQTRDGWHAIGCEPGHMKLASSISRPANAICVKTSIEDVLSGLALRDGAALSRFGAPGKILAIETENRDRFSALAASPEGREIVGRISSLLGQICGDLVLACGAWGGVYVCGGVADALLKHVDPADFISAFDAKGPMSPRMARVKVQQIVEPYPALIGLGAMPLRVEHVW